MYNTKASPAHQVTYYQGPSDLALMLWEPHPPELENISVDLTDVIWLHQPELEATSQVIRSFHVYFLSEMEISQV